MTLVERQDVFTFTWSIRNFSRCMCKENEILYGPYFDFGNFLWRLILYPKGNQCPGFASLYLRLIDYDERSENNTFMYVLSCQKCNGLFKESIEFGNGPSPKECKNFLSLDELYKPGAYLDQDVLTLRCRVWYKGADLSKSVHCFAETKIKIAKLNYMWILEDLVDSDGIPKQNFKRRTGVLNFSSHFPGMVIHLSTAETCDDDDAINFAIDKKDSNDSNPLSVVYKMNLLNSSGSVVHSISGEALFQNAGDVHKIPFLSMRKLLFYKDLYFSSGKLTMQFELSSSNNTFEVQKVDYGMTDKLKFNSEKHNIASLKDVNEIWKRNLQQFYSEGKYSDLIVRTPKKEFPVHKAILCSQSEVFDAMLTHDMKEKNSGVIEIPDFDDETVSKMLTYLYTNTLDDMDYALAKDLYLAADVYRLTALQIVCSNHLMEIIDTSNVYEILLLGEQDQALKSSARDFILSHAYEIMNSDGWKNLMETNSRLTSETMHWMILQNYLSLKK